MLEGNDEAEEEEGEVGEGNVNKAAGPIAEGAVFDGVVAEQDHTIKHKMSLMNIGLGNLDLANMVNGYPDEVIENKPFDKSFIRKSILSWWWKMRFLPMN